MEKKQEMHIPVKVEDLKIGDELLIPMNRQLAGITVLREPKLSKTRKCWWDRSKYVYVSTLCSCTITKFSRKYPNSTYIWNGEKYETTFDTANLDKRFDLNSKDIWLVRRQINQL